MNEVLKKAPDQTTWWKDKHDRLPEPWWRFLYLHFHRDPGLGGLDAEYNGIIRRFRNYVLVMSHSPVHKHAASALALVDRKPKIFMPIAAYSPVIQNQFKGPHSLRM